jgi:hypothetical protein
MPDPAEFELFKTTLYEKLPVTFRVNPGIANFQEVVKMLKDPNFLEKYSVKQEGESGEIKMGQADH